MKTPRISVLMGVLYHREDLSCLERSIRSILAQSKSDFEFLICDDGSCADACKLLDSLACKDNRIQLLRPGRKITLSEKLNYCLGQASGSYIARMDDDDFSHPNRFAEQAAFLDSHPNIAFVGCNVNLCRNGQKVGERRFPEYPQVKDFYFVQPYIHPALIFRREALMAVNGYSEEKRCFLCEDYDLLLRLYAAGYHGCNLQETLFDYTVPVNAKGNRTMAHRCNEAVTRWRRFRELKQLPRALPYVIKPLAVGLVPEQALKKLKASHDKGEGVLSGMC